MPERSTWTRDLAEHLDRFGNIKVQVEIGGGPGTTAEPRETGASAPPPTVARFLRELADDIERTHLPEG
jgi:hypothetical protein